MKWALSFRHDDMLHQVIVSDGDDIWAAMRAWSPLDDVTQIELSPAERQERLTRWNYRTGTSIPIMHKN